MIDLAQCPILSAQLKICFRGTIKKKLTPIYSTSQ